MGHQLQTKGNSCSWWDGFVLVVCSRVENCCLVGYSLWDSLGWGKDSNFVDCFDLIFADSSCLNLF